MPELLLNDLLAALADPQTAVREDESRYTAHIEAVAERVAREGRVRALMLAGPSGSGKTTSANRLADAMRARGTPSMVISLDDFYLDADDPAYPCTPEGAQDFESVEALDLEALTATLSDIVAERAFSVPHYDFKRGARDEVRHYEAAAGECVIIEGLHALNPRICSPLPAERLLRVFISVSTNLATPAGRLLSGRKMRFLRRLVRDRLYRGAGAERTLTMWQGVLAGEERYLYPFRSLADVDFNTFHRFELSALKPYAEPLLTEELRAQSQLVATVHGALACLPAIPQSLISDDSLIREFIPGGTYESIY